MLVNRACSQASETGSLVHPAGVVVTVMTHDGTAETGAFDERRVGLDHWRLGSRTAMNCDNGLSIWMRRGVTHSGIVNIGLDRRLS